MINEVTNETMAKFSHYRKGIMYYMVETEDVKYILPIEMEIVDGKDYALPKETTVLSLMKYLKKALSKGAFIRVPKV